MHAVDGVSLHVDPGETLGIVGESGCGKTMTALSIMNLLPVGGHIVGGSIKLDGREISELVRRRDAQDPRQRDRHDLPGPADLAEPDDDRRQADRRGGLLHREVSQGAGQGPGRRGARPGRDAAGQGADRGVPAPVLRRHAAARDDRDGAGLRAEAAHRRRADHRAGRDDPEADPGADRRPAAAAGHVGHPGHPRPGRDRRPRRPGGGHVRGQDRRDHRHRHAVRQPAAPLHRGAVPGAAGQGRGDQGAAVLDPGRAAGPDQPAGGLPVRAALPVRHRPLPGGGAAAGRRDAGAPVRVLLPGRRPARAQAGPRRRPSTWRRRSAEAPSPRPARRCCQRRAPGQGLPGDQGSRAAAAGRLGQRGRRRELRHPHAARPSAWSASPAAARPRSAG